MVVRTDNLAGSSTAATTDFYYAGPQMSIHPGQAWCARRRGDGGDGPIRFLAAVRRRPDSRYANGIHLLHFDNLVVVRNQHLLLLDGREQQRHVAGGFQRRRSRTVHLLGVRERDRSLAGLLDRVQHLDSWQNVTFAGMWFDPKTGLAYTPGRWFSPVINISLTQDPAQQGVNWYAYAGDDPTNATDPTGLFRSEDIDGDWDMSNVECSTGVDPPAPNSGDPLDDAARKELEAPRRRPKMTSCGSLERLRRRPERRRRGGNSGPERRRPRGLDERVSNADETKQGGKSYFNESYGGSDKTSASEREYAAFSKLIP